MEQFKIFWLVVCVIQVCLSASPDQRDLSLSVLRFRIDGIQTALSSLRPGPCQNETSDLLRATVKGERWANQMMDSWSKASTGSLVGSRFQMGNFDGCVSAKLPSFSPINPQYCLAEVTPSKLDASRSAVETTQPIWPGRQEIWSATSPLLWASCLPKSCSVNDTAILIKAALQLDKDVFPQFSNFTSDIDVFLKDHSCHDDTKRPLQPLDHAFLVLIAISLSILTLSTVYDVFIHKQGQSDKDMSVPSAILLAFSVRSNISKLVKWSPSELNLDCVIGIKFYCMLLIIAGHGVVFLVTGPVDNADFVHEAVQQLENGYLLNGMLFVDSFLVVSGFLLTRLLLIELDKRKSVNLGLLYVFRYIRLTPAYFIVILFYCSLLPRMGSGPLWKMRLYLERDRCRASWWANLLYINNYVNTDQLCMFQSWYIAADTQLFMIAPLIILPLWRRPSAGRWLLGLATIVTAVVPFFVTWLQRLDPVLLIRPWEMPMGDLSGNAMYQAAIIRTHMRACSYSVGLVLGWAVHRWQINGNDRTLPPIVRRAGWWLSGIAAVGSLFSVSFFYREGHGYSAVEAASYAALHRFAWAAATAWLIFACVTGHGGIAQRILTWRPMIPLSRLTYCAYLANGIVVLRASATVRSPRHLNTYDLAMEVVSQIFATFLAGLLLSLMFESPIHGIERILLRKARPAEDTVAKPTNDPNETTQPQPPQEATSQL